jgi:hypothetical protein
MSDSYVHSCTAAAAPSKLLWLLAERPPGPGAQDAAELVKRAPAVQLLGINYYGDKIGDVLAKADAGWVGKHGLPYAVTEYGPNNWWQVEETSWGAEIEPSSTDKAATYILAYDAISRSKAAGSYAFLWGWKQQRTPTWVGLLNLYTYSFPDASLYGLFAGRVGEESEVVPELQRCWTAPAGAARGLHSCADGAYGARRAPSISDMVLAVSEPGEAELAVTREYRNGEQIYVPPTQGTIKLSVTAAHPGGESLNYFWLVLPESAVMSDGASTEADLLPPKLGFWTHASTAVGLKIHYR